MLVLIAELQESPMPCPDGQVQVSFLEVEQSQEVPCCSAIRMEQNISILNLDYLIHQFSQHRLRITRVSPDFLDTVNMWEYTLEPLSRSGTNSIAPIWTRCWMACRVVKLLVGHIGLHT